MSCVNHANQFANDQSRTPSKRWNWKEKIDLELWAKRGRPLASSQNCSGMFCWCSSFVVIKLLARVCHLISHSIWPPSCELSAPDSAPVEALQAGALLTPHRLIGHNWPLSSADSPTGADAGGPHDAKTYAWQLMSFGALGAGNWQKLISADRRLWQLWREPALAWLSQPVSHLLC